MGDRIKTSLDPDLHDEVLQRHEKTSKSKSQIVNEMVREGYESEPSSFLESFYSNFGGALFVAGAVLGVFESLPLAVGIMAFGLGLMLYASVKAQMSARNVGARRALKMTLLG